MYEIKHGDEIYLHSTGMDEPQKNDMGQELEKLAAERIIGIDFGTSTSVIRVKRYVDGIPEGSDRLAAKQVVFNGTYPTVPTAIQKAGENVLKEDQLNEVR